MHKDKGKSLWVVIRVESGIPVLAKVFKQENPAKRCLNSWGKTVREDYDTVGLLESKVN
ncbi:MAG: hypothetical protein ABIH23_02575 [bacterium]